MAILTGCWTCDLAIALISIFSAIYLFFRYSYQHWEKLKVPYAKPKFPLGSFGLGGFTRNLVEVLDDIYKANKKERIVGLYSTFVPVLMIRDLNVIKDVLVKEFMSFHDRGIFTDEELDPLSGNLFMIGGSKWKNLRAKLSPTFTSGKMKMMFHIFADQSAKLADVVREDIAKNEIIEVKETMARFTTDVISSAAFGIETNSLRNPDSIFRKMGKKLVEPSFMNALRGIIFNTPKLAKMLKMRIFTKELSDFFLNTVQETMDYREKNNVKRNDFLQLLMQLKNKGEIEDVDEGKKENKESSENKNIQKFTFEQATAQAFLFFIAGFETSSTAMQFALYEMALHPDLQEKAREEVKEILKKHNGEMTYEAIQEMKYLGRFIDETLRLFPPAPLLIRESTRDYKIPDSDWVIAKGTTVQIPIYSIQRDPNYFPDPERFDPDRFTEEVKSSRHHYAYLPFGEGPRNCIGMRFGLMQTKVGLARLIMNFKIDICEKSPVPMVLNPVGGLAPKGGMYLRITELK